MHDNAEYDKGVCAACGARVPMDLLAEHLAEHHLDITADDVRSAPVVDMTGEEGDA